MRFLENIDPYRLFFPIGLLYAAWGALVWVLFWRGVITYPGTSHALLMVGGFLYSFITGFLLTAVPRFTGTRKANGPHLVLALLLNISFLFSVLSGAPQVLTVSLIGTIAAHLMYFFIQAWMTRSTEPPVHFFFGMLGLGFAILGCVTWNAASLGWLDMRHVNVARSFLFQASLLFLVVGIGARLVPMLLGHSVNASGLRGRAYVQAGLLALGFFLEAAELGGLGRVVRAVAVSWVSVAEWQIWKRPLRRGRLPNWLWVSCWALVLGLWGHVFFPQPGAHALHLSLVAGLGLMVLMIATRVTLSHGGYDLSLELSSSVVRWTGVLLVAAALTRVFAPIIPELYFSHLAYAAMTWLAGVLLWMSYFLTRILWRRE